MTTEYMPIPVQMARQIAEATQRDIVTILAWSHEHQLLHTTTYGVTAADKVTAARMGDIATQALGMDLLRSEVSEDFRKDLDAGKQCRMLEVIRKHLPALKKMAGQIIHPSENTFSRMVRDFEDAIKDSV